MKIILCSVWAISKITEGKMREKIKSRETSARTMSGHNSHHEVNKETYFQSRGTLRFGCLFYFVGMGWGLFGFLFFQQNW